METILLTEICSPKQWKTISSSKLSDSGYPVYGANGVIGHYSDYTHEEPTVLITCRGATCGTINVSQPKSYVNGNAMALDNLRKDYNLNFLKYILIARGLDDVISGSAQPQITRTGLKNVRVPNPPLKTQQRIAGILDDAATLRDKTAQLLTEYDLLAQSIFLEMFGDPFNNQNNFELGTIRDLVREAKYGTSAKAGGIGQFSYLRMNNLTYSGHMDYEKLKYVDIPQKDIEKYIVRKGDILFNRTNSRELVGKTAIFDSDTEMVAAGYLIRVRINELGNPYFIWGYLNSKHGKLILNSMCKNIVGMANINAQELQNIKILLPPINLQNEFADKVALIEQQKALAKQELQESEDLFNCLLQQAFKGELV
jgi:type I restriction enzyme S subunit